MKNNLIKKTLAIILVALSIISVACFGITNASAAAISGRIDIYNIKFYTGNCEGATTKDGVHVAVLAYPVPDINYDFNFYSYFYNCGTRSGETQNALRHHELGEYLKGFRFTIADKNDPWYLERVEVTLQNQGLTYSFGVYDWVTDSITLNTSDMYDNIYKITVKTADSQNAGTDAMVDFKVRGGNSTIYHSVSNHSTGKDCFNKGNTYTFYANLEYNTFDNLEISTSNDESTHLTEFTSLFSSDWKVESVEVEKVHGANKEQEHLKITVNQWIDYKLIKSQESEELIIGKNGTPTNAYQVEVKTSSVSKAGTDADIDFQLVCENETSLFSGVERFCDEYSSATNNFEKGDKDKFQMIFTHDIYHYGRFGEITGLNIRNNGGGAGPAWHVDYIKLTEIVPEGTTPRTYTFHINDWIYEDQTFYCTDVTVS